MKSEVEEIIPVHKMYDCFNESEPFDFGIKKLEEINPGQKIIKLPHRHDFYYVLFVKQGHGSHMIDFKQYDVKPCSIFFISPGQVHALELSEEVEGYAIFFKPSFYLMDGNPKKILDFPFFHSMSNEPTLFMDCIVPIISQNLEEIYNEFHTFDIGRNNVIRALIDVLLVRLSRKYPRPQLNDFPVRLTYQIRELEALVDHHFKEYRTLDDYADKMNISPKHLNNICKKALDKTVINLIHERTIIEAKRLLLFTDFTVSQIAYELGYYDKSYFMRFFKKNTNLTPETYRQSNREINFP